VKLTVDAVVFGYQDQKLHLLLIKRKIAPFQGHWALPGGFVLPGESLEAAIERELKEETGAQINYLEQLYTFGAPDRDPREHIVTVAYFALVNPHQFALSANTDADDVQWFAVQHLPDLAFDHRSIVDYALHRLRGKLSYEPIGLNLLPEIFPLSALQKLYETILDRKVERSNFRKKFLSFSILQEYDVQHTTQKGRPGTRYKFNEEKYLALKKEGIIFEIK
jgi:8-oxo-dGTP diphosphatase